MISKADEDKLEELTSEYPVLRQIIKALVTEARIDERNKCQEVINHLANARMDLMKYSMRYTEPKENKQ